MPVIFAYRLFPVTRMESKYSDWTAICELEVLINMQQSLHNLAHIVFQMIQEEKSMNLLDGMYLWLFETLCWLKDLNWWSVSYLKWSKSIGYCMLGYAILHVSISMGIGMAST